MLYSEIIVVCSQIHTKHINTLCWQKVEFMSVKRDGTYVSHWDLRVFKRGFSQPSLLLTAVRLGRYTDWALEADGSFLSINFQCCNPLPHCLLPLSKRTQQASFKILRLCEDHNRITYCTMLQSCMISDNCKYANFENTKVSFYARTMRKCPGIMSLSWRK
jgi:hypothetical protein